MYLSPRKKLFVDTATEMFGAGATINKKEMVKAAFSVDIPEPYWFQKACKVGYNQFKLPNEEDYGVPASSTTTVLLT